MSKGFKVFLILFTVFILTPAIPRFTGIDDGLKKYADQVEKLSNGNLKLTNAHFGRVWADNVLGQCNTIYGTITINKKLWNKMSEKVRLLILAHEALHCLKDADHANDFGLFCPKNIMYPSSPGKWCVENHWDRYVKQMREWK